MSLEEVIKSEIKSQGYSIRSFSEKINLPSSTLSTMLKTGLKKSSVDNVIKICKGLDIKISDLLQEESETVDNILRSSEKSDFYDYIPYSMSAGSFIEIPNGDTYDKIEIPNVFLGKYAGKKSILVTTVNGESMNKEIKHGSYIFVDRYYDNIDKLKNGEIILAKDYSGYTVKKIYKDKINKRIILRPNSTDPTFADIIISEENYNNVKIIGKIVTKIESTII